MRVPTRQRSGQTLDVEPIGPAGLDQNTHPTLIGPDKLRTARNVSLVDDMLSRRKASVKTSRFTDATKTYGSKTLGNSDAKYAWFTPPLIPKGGFALKGALTTRRGAATRYYVSSWTSAAQSFRVVEFLYSTAGLFTVTVDWDDLTTTSVSVTVADARSVTFLVVYDPHAGTFTLYLDGAQAAQATGLSSELQPKQTASVRWYLGLSYKPGTGPQATTGANAPMGPFICFAFRGADITAGYDADPLKDSSLLMEIRMGTFQDWPNPVSRMILFHYPMREASAGTAVPMYDASKFQNDGAYVGTPTTAAQLVWPALNGNYAGNVRKAALGALSDASVNLVGVAGAAYYNEIEGGV